MSKFKKIDKEFQLTDSSVNCYGFRLLTDGYQQDLFARNPIGYYMHERDGGVVLKWEDFRTEGDAVYAKPVVNLSNPRGQQTVDEIENGFLNAASVGHILVMETSDDPALQLAGQTGPTVTKWSHRELSVVDIPGNFNSLKLFDADENPLNLADFSSKSSNKLFEKMKQVFLSAEQLGKLNLKADTADVAAVDVALNDLVAKAEKVDGLTTQLAAATTAKTTAETALSDLKKSVNTEKVETILADALAAGKITKETSNKLKVKFAEDADGLQDLVADMPVYSSITKKIEEGNNTGAPDLAAMHWKELHEKGLLEQLKATDLAAFKTKYKEEFKKEYNG